MPQVIAAGLVSTGAFAAGSIATIVVSNAIAIAITVRYGQIQRNRLKNQANANLDDRTSTFPTSDDPHTIIYGRTRVWGSPKYAKNYGSRLETVAQVIPIAGHEITAIDDIWFGDKSIGTLPASPGGPVPPSSPFYANQLEARTNTFIGDTAGETRTLAFNQGFVSSLDTLAYTTNVVKTDTIDTIIISGGQTVLLKEGEDYSFSGSTITLLNNKTVGLDVTASFRIQVGAPKAAVYWQLGLLAGERDTDLETKSGGEWASTAVGKSIARLRVDTTWDETIYATGLPAISAIARGKKVYDPRLDSTNGGSGSHRANDSTTWAYSENPALCAADYLRDQLGFKCASSEINWASVIVAANVCDELVPIDSVPNYQKRYVIAGVLSTEAARKENLESILDSMVGIAFYAGGRWSIKAGAYSVPTLDLNEDDLAGGDISINQSLPRRELFNSVRGRYREPNQLYQVVDFPLYESSTYIADDNGETIYNEIDLPMVDNAIRAQRIAKLILHRSRQALTVVANWKLPAYALEPGDTCRISIARYGWVNKIFRVHEREFSDSNTVKLTLQEDSVTLYSWAFNEARDPDPAPNTSLPDPRYVKPPENVSIESGPKTYYLRQDGTIIPYVRVSWDVPVPDDVRVQVFYKRINEPEYKSISGAIGDSEAKIENVAAGETLNIYVQAYNSIGARSIITWNAAYVVAANSLSGLKSNAANLLKDTTFVGTHGSWEKAPGNIPDSQLFLTIPSQENGYPNFWRVYGSPSNLLFEAHPTAPFSGIVSIQSSVFQVEPGKHYIVFAALLSQYTHCEVELRFYDANGNTMNVSRGNDVEPVGSPVYYRTEDYKLSVARGTAAPGARQANILIVGTGSGVPPGGGLGTFNAGPHFISVFKPMACEIPETLSSLPDWDSGGSNVVGFNQITYGAVTQKREFNHPAGFTITAATLIAADFQLDSFVAEAAGTLEVTATFNVYAESLSGASAISVGIFQNTKLELVTRPVFTVVPGAPNQTSMTLTASIPVLAGDTVAPMLRLSRTRFGIGIGNTADSITAITGRCKLHKV